jgi:ketosteroid isomerase-like protein
MKNQKKNLLKLALLVLFSVTITVNYLWAQKSSERVKSEITEALNTWNAACKSANIDLVMSMLDNTEGLMVVGSAGGEINKGYDESKAWVSQIFGFAGFSWEMNRIDIDSNGKTAWVFVDGKMIVEFHKGGKKVTPYRFTGIMVKKNGVWKWRLFDGSVPQQE